MCIFVEKGKRIIMPSFPRKKMAIDARIFLEKSGYKFQTAA
jgi:hypothetical protein